MHCRRCDSSLSISLSPLLAFVHKVEEEEVFGHCLSISSGIVLKLLPPHVPYLQDACFRTEITHRFLMLPIHRFQSKGQ